MIKEQYQRLIKELNPKPFLINVSIIDNQLQFDYYNHEIITSYIMKDKIEIIKDKIYKKPTTEIKELNLGKIKITLNQALEITNKELNDQVQRKIIILQNLDEPTWNISYITTSFKILNIKINAINGKIINKTYESILALKKS